MRNRRQLTSDHEGTREIWPAFTDVMSTMALILFVLVLLAYVRNLVSGKALDALQRQIASSQLQLRNVNDDLRRTSAEVRAGRTALSAAQTKLEGQELALTDSNRQLGTLRSQLESIAVLRVDVLNKLKQAIEAELGPKNVAGLALVTIGDNGNIVINESLVFESGSYAIKPDAKPLLNGLARALGNLLADKDVRENIDAIVIQGHTDDRGSAAYNWDLSAKRATAVLDYLFETNKTLASSYGRYFAASAYSKFRPINGASTGEALQQNRRIEVSVIPRDANVRKVIDDYMRGGSPGTARPDRAVVGGFAAPLGPVAPGPPFVRRSGLMRRLEASAISLSLFFVACGQSSGKGSAGRSDAGDAGVPTGATGADSASGSDSAFPDAGSTGTSDSGDDSGAASGSDSGGDDSGATSGSDSGGDSGTVSGSDGGGTNEAGATGCTPLTIDSTTLVDNTGTDTYEWSDSSCKPRTAALFRNETTDGLGDTGGYLRTLTYQTLGQSRTCTGTSSSAGQFNGFGYVVDHYASTASDTAGILGNHVIVLAGRHHAIHQFTWTVSIPSPVDVTAQWVFATGRDHPLFVITFDATPSGPNVDYADTRAPYGDMGFDNNEGGDVTGEGWGDTHKLTTTGPGPVTATSPWDYTAANTIPYAFEWSGSTDSEMGLVAMQAWTTTIQGGDYAGGSLENLWGKTGTDLLTDIPNYEWPFQLNQYQLGPPGVTNSHRLAWGLTYGAVGQTSYTAFGKMLVGYPFQSYTVAIVLGAHSVSAVGGQVGQMENVQAATLTAARGTVSTSGPAGIVRADTQPYVPAGFDPVYGVWDAQAAANAATLTLTPGAGSLVNPVFRLHGYTASAPPSKVTFGGAMLTADTGYFATVDTATTSLWLTLNATVGTAGTLTVDP